PAQVANGNQASRHAADLVIRIGRGIKAKNFHGVDVNVSIEERCDIRILICGSPERMVHNERAGFPQPLMPDEIRGAKRGSVVGGRRLDIDFFKWSMRANLAVGDTVHGASSREAQAFSMSPVPNTIQTI